MKKFLPVIIFVLSFTAVIVGQVVFHTFTDTAHAGPKDSVKDEKYASFEKIFIAGNYQTIDGKKFEIAKVKAPVVIFNFWASWCVPCLEEIPSMVQMKKKLSDDQVLVLAFNTDEDNQLKNINKTIKKLNLNNEFSIIADQNSQVALSFGLSAVPATVIYRNGKVVHFSNGPMDFNSEEMILKLKKWSAN